MFFEIDDVKRRHSPYYDVYNIRGWVDPPEDRFSWHWIRGAVAGATGAFVNQFIANRWEAYKTIREAYHPPRTFEQLYHYKNSIKEVIRVDKVL